LRRAGFCILLAVAVLFSSVRCAKHVSVQPVVDPALYGRLAVLPFETQSVFSTIGYQVADEIVLELIEKAPEFHIVERSRIDALLLERNLESEGLSTGKTALEAARLLGVDAIITGSVSVSIEDISPAPEHEERRASGIALIRLIDADDGRVLWASRVEGEYSALTYLYGYVYRSQTDHDIVQEVVREIAHEAARYFYPHSERR
jgi:curli biogenesis system outer membrane secretion channel CsgG